MITDNKEHTDMGTQRTRAVIISGVLLTFLHGAPGEEGLSGPPKITWETLRRAVWGRCRHGMGLVISAHTAAWVTGGRLGNTSSSAISV